MNAIRIRPARAQDAPDLAELAGQLGYPLPEGAALQRLGALAGDPRHVVLVADDGAGRALGFAHAEHVRGLVSEPHVELAALVVDERARGRGVGAALLAGAEDWTRALGLRLVRLRSRTTRERAHAFYRRAGYRAVKTQLVLERELDRG